tara:strand:- start:3812 stop:4156 length:345 start_codon:yes stop_codon:yes gene_type:complete
MPVPIALTDCLGLIDLMLTGDEHSPHFTLSGVQCAVERIESHHACFEAVTSDFGMIAIFPGWYAGEHEAPVYVLIVGDHQACLQWLPIDRNEKCVIIERLSFDEIDKTMLTLAV